MTAIRPRRSILYVPGANERAMEKAATLEADVIILDLEDSVAPDAKEAARERVAKSVSARRFGRRQIVVRINGPDSLWGQADLQAAAACKPDAVLVPKVSEASQIRWAAAGIAAAGSAAEVWAMIETPAAILSVATVAKTATDPALCFRALVLGTNDLAKDTRTRIVPGRWTMVPWLVGTIAAARAYGLDVFDGVYTALDDAAGFRAECEQARDLGFDGKTLIHPNQVEAANEVFAPSAAEVDDARRILAVFERPENANAGVISLDGRMVERLHAEMARRIVALAHAIER